MRGGENRCILQDLNKNLQDCLLIAKQESLRINKHNHEKRGELLYFYHKIVKELSGLCRESTGNTNLRGNIVTFVILKMTEKLR